jgi:hypothetical protein
MKFVNLFGASTFFYNFSSTQPIVSLDADVDRPGLGHVVHSAAFETPTAAVHLLAVRRL